jgi:hypothetical protein
VSAELLWARTERLDICGVVDVFGRADPATAEVILRRIPQALLRQGAAPPQLPADARGNARAGWARFADLDLTKTGLVSGWFGLSSAILRESALGIPGKRSERLLALCQLVGARRYAARDYLDTELFARNGIEVEWQDYVHPVYPQQHGDFVPYLSIVDLLFNCGEESAAILGRAGVSERL